MIDFKTIQLLDREIINSFLENYQHQGCDFCFTNLFAWQPKYKTSFTIIQNTLFIRFLDSELNNLCYQIPIGKMNLKHSLQMIIDDAKENNINLIIKNITKEMWAEINEVMPNTFQYQNDRDNADYIYLSQRLINLTGRKLQSKRNHINHFKIENPNWKYYPLSTIEDIEDCSKMLDNWEDMNIHKAQQSLRYDYIATKAMLDNFHSLQLKGGAIRVNDKIIAFAIGEPLTADTFVVHVEKAVNGYNGAYTIINQQFAEHEASKFLYINREEDMGFEYLRKAKMSYHPDLLLEKMVLTLEQVNIVK